MSPGPHGESSPPARRCGSGAASCLTCDVRASWPPCSWLQMSAIRMRRVAEAPPRASGGGSSGGGQPFSVPCNTPPDCGAGRRTLCPAGRAPPARLSGGRACGNLDYHSAAAITMTCGSQPPRSAQHHRPAAVIHRQLGPARRPSECLRVLSFRAAVLQELSCPWRGPAGQLAGTSRMSPAGGGHLRRRRRGWSRVGFRRLGEPGQNKAVPGVQLEVQSCRRWSAWAAAGSRRG